ncbi:MAG: queuosine precursor transporter [Bacteroidales bacterium]|nr:queuosine precursor transporter [Bacteroidales bacterium]
MNKTTYSPIFLVLAIVFNVCLITSNLFVPRLWQVGSLPFQLPGAVILFPISYIINDCLTEVYGFRKAQTVIWTGFAMCLFVTLVSLLVTNLPAPLFEDSREIAASFDRIFGFVPRSMAGSLLAFVFGSTMNAWVMSKMKVATGGRGFGLRAILSSLAGELTDSLIFMPIAFAGILPAKVILTMMLTQVTAKVLYEIIILPVTTIVVRKLKQREGIDTYDRNISYNPFNLAE